MIVCRRVLEQTLYLLRRAVTALPTEVQPPLPIQSMIGFGLPANLVGETKASASLEKGAKACIQHGLVFDVMQAY